MADQLVRGRIEESSSRTTKSGQRVWTFVIGGQKYTTFESTFAEEFAPGDYVEVEFRTKGQYKNIVNMQAAEEGPQPPPRNGGKQAVAPDHTALKLEVLRLASQAAPDKAAAQIVEYADAFWRWLTGRRAPNRPVSAPTKTHANNGQPVAAGGPLRVLEAKLKAAKLNPMEFLEWAALEGLTNGLATDLRQLTPEEAQACVNKFTELVGKHNAVAA